MVVSIKVVEYIFKVNIQFNFPEDYIMVVHLKSRIQITSGFMTFIDEYRRGQNRYMSTLFMNLRIVFIFVLDDVSSSKS